MIFKNKAWLLVIGLCFIVGCLVSTADEAPQKADVAQKKFSGVVNDKFVPTPQVEKSVEEQPRCSAKANIKIDQYIFSIPRNGGSVFTADDKIDGECKDQFFESTSLLYRPREFFNVSSKSIGRGRYVAYSF